MSRPISYWEAINEALIQEMHKDDSVIVYGIGVPDYKRVFGTTNSLLELFGAERCFDMPLSEDSMMGFGIGAAANGLRPIYIHIRVDFLLLAMNQLVNMLSSYTYSTGSKVPIVIRAIVGRGWGQGCHHSKSLHSYFTHIPGLIVIAPTTPYDAKGLMKSAIVNDNPVVCLEHRWLYWAEDEVPVEEYYVPIRKSNVLKEGTDVTVVATSWMCVEAMKAAEILERKVGISLEIVDPRTLAPLDHFPIVESVSKTGYCIVADNDWIFSGYGAELAATVYKECFYDLKAPIERIGFLHTPCPTVRSLENEFYPNARSIIRTVEKLFEVRPTYLEDEDFYSHERRFKGPF